MKIDLLCVGKVKESYFRDAMAEYLKRLKRYAKVLVIEVADEKTDEKASAKEELIVLEKEAARLQSHMDENAFVITLEIEGKSLSSEQLAQKIDTLGMQGVSHIQFVIGGSLGLAQTIKNRSDFALSFSAMTFPHQLMRVIALEQIYRAYRIIHKQPYHK